MLFCLAIFIRAARRAAVNNGCDQLPETFGLLDTKGGAGVHKYRATKFCIMSLNVCGYSVWNLLCVSLQAPGILMCVQGFWKICAPLCFTPRHIKEGIHFTFRHIFLVCCWVGPCCSAVNIGLYSCSGLNMSSQNVRGSVITARTLTTPYLFWRGFEGRLSLVRVEPVILACCLPRWSRNQLRESLACWCFTL
jgi:hypothetical protein